MSDAPQRSTHRPPRPHSAARPHGGARRHARDGLDPGALRVEPAPGEPAPSVGLRAAEVIAEQRARMWAKLAAAIEGRDPEGVHDMRVASRRLRACLRLFAPWIDDAELGRIAPSVRGATRALGAVRELDVLRLRIAGFAAHATPERALALELLDTRIARRRRRARAKMMARFARVGLDRLERRLRRLETHLARGAASAHGGARHARQRHGEADTLAAGEAAPRLDEASELAPAVDGVFLADTQEAAAAAPAPAVNGAPGTAVAPDTPAADVPFAAALEHIAAEVLASARAIEAPEIPDEIGSTPAAEALHRVRIAAKKLRYQLEIAAPYLGDAGPVLVKHLRQLQEHLGDFHDDTVLDAELGAAIQRATEREQRRLASELRRFRSLRRRALLRDERALRLAIESLARSGFSQLLGGALQHAGVPAAQCAPTSKTDRLHVEAKGAGTAS